jgi:hypothetical protein
LPNYGKASPRRKSKDTRRRPKKVRYTDVNSDGMIMCIDKERYSKELKELARSNKTLNKPKKPLTPYMLFVREVSL